MKHHHKCRAIGVCRLPTGHTGICLFHPRPEPPSSVAITTTGTGEVLVDFGAAGRLTLTPSQAVDLGTALVRRGYKLRVDYVAVH